ncbi:AmmeMemoRadiSam system radical SAM enzyme [Treponema phagedenis]|uniref:AmmeMemoRadiSam system radical SAM enzyme n=1 Tax=Treponema phagedenis TaxID=162 RepID=A0A0B7GXE0_TREPH|nr:AmmeMemoRadiSam system radical SAM enzyme [Treponema phagedenis]QEJ94480.1 AmmeMemoRadiSam system radical SAM enzyme [Treponema phagedenis]QEJ97547.1 AmmeMemoRadiSam system radical SAM enzyme [Treponema phagedenis]QEK03114.1 AmmeMemoRadiSam system radical SAM enzyme [Treponema phagedenis]QEK08740.1 AmmeMemoRadiSam system radical SAM enzyme [Treponema phagedenis]QSH95905.1 AmmeMemoRadiSam system radical SAM enzyme [Treponema phagedenis]
MKQAFFWAEEEKRCLLCPHRCIVPEGKISRCGVRKNIGGVLYSLNYGKVLAAALDPIEKKPLYRFYPGSKIFSVGTFGCNFDCAFCQNHSLVHAMQENAALLFPKTSPEQLVSQALQTNSIGIAFTYNEPTVWYEYIADTAPLAKQAGLKTVLVTNGFIEEVPLTKILPVIDAMNIDLKAFSQDYYAKLCKGSVEPVLRSIRLAAKHCHVEVTCLVIEGKNSEANQMEQLASELANISTDIPLHISAFYPAYKMQDTPPTAPARILQLCKIAKKQLTFVFPGNI